MAAEAKQLDDMWVFPKTFDELTDFVNLNDSNLWMCVLFTVLTPLVWNLICRWEYNTRVFSKMFGSAKLACATLSLTQISISNTRNYYFKEALAMQPHFETPFNDILNIAGYFLMVIGAMFVVTSFMRLGWFGTWHGDHFGILLKEKVTGFPFNILDHPMYDGAVLLFLGMSLGNRSLSGMALTFWVQIVYKFTEMVEGPFTDMIYAKAASEKKRTSSKAR